MKFVINSNCAGGNRVCAMMQDRTDFFKFYTLNRSEPYNFRPFYFFLSLSNNYDFVQGDLHLPGHDTDQRQCAMEWPTTV
jgi:hypothetical protein